MKYSWIIVLCFIFGSGILCFGKFGRRQAVPSSFFYRNTEKKFNCSNGMSIQTSMVCDGHKDCSDGSDETKEMCARNEHGTNMTMDCGRVYIINQGRIDNDQKAPEGTAPWNAVMYQFNEIDPNWEFLCGGSIISSKLVVTAARYFWRPMKYDRRIIKNDGFYKIAVGKYDRNISIIDNEFTQIMDVESVYQREDYDGHLGLYANDIAVVVLKNRISFSNNIAPVCIDWNGKYNVDNGDQGKIVGWGNPNEYGYSPVLLEISLRYINYTSCRNINIIHSYVTDDKFCAYSEWDSQVVILGYIGAGLSFFHDSSYYLTGVMSVKYAGVNKIIAGFTDVNYHIQWIRGLYNKHK